MICGVCTRGLYFHERVAHAQELCLPCASASKAGRRKLAIPPALVAMLHAWCAGRPGDEPIFVGSTGRVMHPSSARRHVRRVCDLAGVPVLPPQALRRTWASLADQVGEAPLAIARHLGHSAQVTEQSYMERGAVAAAKGERVLRVIRGGRP